MSENLVFSGVVLPHALAFGLLCYHTVNSSTTCNSNAFLRGSALANVLSNHWFFISSVSGTLRKSSITFMPDHQTVFRSSSGDWTFPVALSHLARACAEMSQPL